MKITKDFLNSINESLNKQNNLYGQYKVILDNTEDINNLINEANLDEQEEINYFLQLGILFLKLFLGKNCILLKEKNNDEKNDKEMFIFKKFYDGLDDKFGNINNILGENFYVDYDNDLEPMSVE